MRRSFALLLLLTCQQVRAQEPLTAPPILVLDSGGHTSRVSKVLFTPDGKELISVSDDKTIRFWDVASGEPIRVIRPPIEPGNRGMLYAAALSPDGRTLAIGGYGLKDALGSIYLISLATGRIERVLKGHTDAINSLAFGVSPGGRLLLASGSTDKTARIWDVATGECLRVLEGHTDAVHCVAFAPDASRLATASFDKTGRIWSVADGRCLQTLQGHTKIVNSVAWSPDGTLLATGGDDRSIRLWSPDGALSRTIKNLDNWIFSVLFTADSRELLYTLGGPDYATCGAAVLRASSGQERVRFTKNDNTVYSGAISPDGTMAATAGGDSDEIYLWKLTDAALVHRLAGKGKPNWSAGWSPDSMRIAWGNTHAFNFFFFNDNGPLERSFTVADLEFGPSPDARYRRARESLGSLSLQRTGPTSIEVRKQDAVVAKIAPPYDHERIRSFSFVTGDRVAVGGDFGLYLFDARTGANVREFRGHTGEVWAVAPSPDGRFLLSASDDQTLRIWDPDRDDPLLSLFFAGDDWIAWTPEGYYAASPGGENLMGWQVSNGPEQVGNFAAASQFHKSLYRPDVIKLALKTGSVALALERLNEAAKIVKEVLPPLVAIASPDSNGARLDKPELEVRAVAKAEPGHPVTAFRLLLDGRPYDGDRGRKDVANDPAADRQKTASWQVRLDPGRHRLAVIAESAVSNGQSDEIEVLYEEQRAEPPRLYIVNVGVSKYPGPLQLRYAADDARAVESVFRANSGALFKSIDARPLVDQDATRRKIIKELNWLGQRMRDQDVGLFFFSGHGAVRDGRFYLLSVDAEVDDLESTAVTAAQLKSILATTKGKLVVLLDACHSGAQAAMLPPRVPIRRIEWSQAVIPAGRLRAPESLLTKFRLLGFQQEGEKQLRPSTDELVRSLANDEHGVITMSSSTGSEVSVESAKLKHGYFTEALTEGLSGKADINNDGDVYLTELDAYLVNRVKDLSNDSQHPVTAKPPGVRPFPLSRSRP